MTRLLTDDEVRVIYHSRLTNYLGLSAQWNKQGRTRRGFTEGYTNVIKCRTIEEMRSIVYRMGGKYLNNKSCL